MTAPTPDWVEQARRFAAGLTADHGAGFADWADQARRFTAGLAAEHGPGAGLTDVLGGFLGTPAGSTTASSTGPEAGSTTGPATTAQSGARAQDPGDHAAECRWCPLCAGLAALRGRRPDLVEALADVLSSAATALRAQSGVPHDPTRTTTSRPTPSRPTPSRTTPDGSDAAPGVPAPDVPAGDEHAPPEETVTHPAPDPVQRIDVA